MKDEDPMPFGKYKGVPIGEVKAEYLVWLGEQDWIEEWPEVESYITTKWSQLEDEVRENRQWEEI